MRKFTGFVVEAMQRAARRGVLPAIAWLIATVAAPASLAQSIAGTGGLEGRVSIAGAPKGQLTVYALHLEKRIGFMVYVVDGKYRATNLFPGRYEVTLRGTPGQMNWDLPQQTAKVRIAAGQVAQADFTLGDVPIPPTYVGGLPYPGTAVAAYDEIYPPGPARRTMERTCFGCHTVNLYPENIIRTYAGGRTPKDRDAWAATIDRMAHGSAFMVPGKASYFDPLLLTPTERNELADYFAANFGVDSKPRAVRQDSDPKLDPAVLAKAQFVEYRFLNAKDGPERFTHTPDFDGQGNVWIMDRGGASLVKIDPVAGKFTDHVGHGGGEFLSVDRDGTVWYGGLSHFDPARNVHDEYRFKWRDSFQPIAASSMVMDSKGDIWLSLLSTGGLAKYDRRKDTVIAWDVPVARSRPYGIILDRDDKVWFADYHAGGVTRFDPLTESFRHYRITLEATSNIRRLAVDSKNFIWSATWGSLGYRNGSLFRIDPGTGEVERFKIEIPFTNPYDVEAAADDSLWIATDNHVVHFEPTTRRFVFYPVTTRTDIPKLAVTRDGAVWFAPRNAGQFGGYGGAATTLYPDKDKITSYAAFYHPDNPRNRKASHEWPATAVTGERKLAPGGTRNPCEFAASVGMRDQCEGKAGPDPAGGMTIDGGAAHE